MSQPLPGQLAYDNATNPRFENDHGPEVFTGLWGDRYLDCCDCSHAWILHASQKMPACCPECGGEFLDLTATAKRERRPLP